ncbi:MAG: hypothetical protein Q7T74_03035 [Candidatus Saccharibacteria bacterium]|nr:hypothetical protein [Candidatus Saccharibacteria bacterium]
MPNKSLVNILKSDFPQINFTSGEYFKWSFDEKTIYFNPHDDDDGTYLLHELAHAILDHRDFDLDVELVRKESEAWDRTIVKLADKYEVDIDQNEAEMSLESYRHWLHQRSKCPDCGTNGLQSKNTHYKCIACGCSWRANDARICGLKRYRVSA